MEFCTYAYTNCGGRDKNEDYYIYGNNLWLVADGLGGHDCGEVASRSASEAAGAFVKKHGVSMNDNFLEDIINVTNLCVTNKQKESDNYAPMRTTLVFAVTNGTVLRYANVGDSRFYYFKKGRLYAQSEDHTVAAASAKLGEISFEEIRNDPDRNKLLKAIGDSEKIAVKVPKTEIAVESGDAFLLCSDGLWEHVYETEMEFDLVKSVSPSEWVNYMVKRVLLKTGNVGNDNFTAVAIIVK